MANCNELARLQSSKNLQTSLLALYQARTALYQSIRSLHDKDGYISVEFDNKDDQSLSNNLDNIFAEISHDLLTFKNLIIDIGKKAAPMSEDDATTLAVQIAELGSGADALRNEFTEYKTAILNYHGDITMPGKGAGTLIGLISFLVGGGTIAGAATTEWLTIEVGATTVLLNPEAVAVKGILIVQSISALALSGIIISAVLLNVPTAYIYYLAETNPNNYASGMISLIYESRIQERETKIQINRLTSKIKELLKYCDLPDATCPTQSKYQGKLFDRADIVEKLDALEEIVPGTENTPDPKILQLNDEIKNHNSEIAILDNDITKYSAFYNLVNSAQADFLSNDDLVNLRPQALQLFRVFSNNEYDPIIKQHKRALASIMAYLSLQTYVNKANELLEGIAKFNTDNIKTANLKSVINGIKKIAEQGSYGNSYFTPPDLFYVKCPKNGSACTYWSLSGHSASFPAGNGWRTFTDSIANNIYHSENNDYKTKQLKFPGLEKLLNDIKSKLISIGAIIQQKETLQSHILVKTFKIAIQKQSNRNGWDSWINEKLNEYYDFSSPDKISNTTTRIPVTKALVADGKPAFKEHTQIKKGFGFDFTYNSDNFIYLFEIAQNHLKVGQYKATTTPFPDGSDGNYPIYEQKDINYNNVNTVKGYSHAGTTHKVYASVVPTTNKLDPVLAKLFNIPTDGTGIPELTADLSICAE